MPDLGELRQRANAFVAASAFRDARSAFDDLKGELVARFGPDHRYVAEVLESLGGAARHAGDLKAARLYFEQACGLHRTLGETTRADSLTHVLAHLDPLSPDEIARRPRLTLSWNGVDVLMVTDQLYIGRGLERVHLLLHNHTLSRVHARVLWRSPHAFEIEDCGSENGTLFDGKPIRCRTISDGDVYVLGDQSLRCRLAIS